MNAKAKALITSIITIALCVSLIAGSTFALFTSESTTNIAVNAGKVEVVATVKDLKVYYAKWTDGSTMNTPEDTEGFFKDENGSWYAHRPSTDNYFLNGGSAVYDESTGTLTLDKMTPGDKVEFNLDITNNSNVAVRYRVKITSTETSALMTGLVVNAIKASENENGDVEIDEATGKALTVGEAIFDNATGLYAYTSEWINITAGEDIEDILMSIELPITAGNEYQGLSANLAITVEAIQGNGNVDYDNDEETEYITAVVYNDDELKAALTADEKNIVVILGNDVTYDVKDNYPIYNMGGASTETITIYGNEHTLTFNALSDNNNNIDTNNGAKLILNNITIDNSGKGATSGAWNAHDIIFACEVEMNNVDSNNAIALKNNATLNEVTITDDSANAAYALWIQAKGLTVTLDNCVIDTNSRGIKIDNQYVTAEDTVATTLVVTNTRFETEEKAAIVVNSVAGANITLDNVDIDAVAADTTNAVWVDANAAASYDQVIVNGGSKYQEQ